MNCSEQEFVCILLRSKGHSSSSPHTWTQGKCNKKRQRAMRPRWQMGGVLEPSEDRTPSHQWNTDLQAASEKVSVPMGARQVDGQHGPLSHHDEELRQHPWHLAIPTVLKLCWRPMTHKPNPPRCQFCLLIRESPQPTTQSLQVRWLHCDHQAKYTYFEAVFKKQGRRCRGIICW